MIPIEKVQDIVAKHDNLEQELSSGKIDAKCPSVPIPRRTTSKGSRVFNLGIKLSVKEKKFADLACSERKLFLMRYL